MCRAHLDLLRRLSVEVPGGRRVNEHRLRLQVQVGRPPLQQVLQRHTRTRVPSAPPLTPPSNTLLRRLRACMPPRTATHSTMSSGLLGPATTPAAGTLIKGCRRRPRTTSLLCTAVPQHPCAGVLCCQTAVHPHSGFLWLLGFRGILSGSAPVAVRPHQQRVDVRCLAHPKM